MKLISAIELKDYQKVITICGGGGKTSTMFKIADELQNNKVLITTTTKILKPLNVQDLDIIIEKDSSNFIEKIKNGQYKNKILCGSQLIENYKIIGSSTDFIKDVKDYFDYVIIEGDGSARKPIKAPAEHEPVVPDFTDIYIGVIGLDSIGKKGDENTVHRPELFSRIRNKNNSEIILKEDLVRLINSPIGLFKSAPKNSIKVVMLNKADLIDKVAANEILSYISKKSKNYNFVLLNSFAEKLPVIMSEKFIVPLNKS